MGHPMAKKSFRFRGEKVLKNRKSYHLINETDEDDDILSKFDSHTEYEGDDDEL